MGIIINLAFKELTFFGGLSFYAFLIVLFALLSHQDYSTKLLFGLFLIYFITLIIRTIYFKPRPKRVEYNNFIEKLNASSFPSVHSARATFLTLFTLLFFSLNSLYTSILLVLWLLVLASRIYLKKHDLFDVFGGFLLGIVTYILVTII